VQGVATFTNYLSRLSDSGSHSQIYKELYQELSSMQRFADFNKKELRAVQAIFDAIEAQNINNNE